MNALDADAAAILASMNAMNLPRTGTVTAAEMRAARVAAGAPAPAGPALEEVCDISVPFGAVDIPVRHYRPARQNNISIIWLHGGGWTFGGIGASDAAVRRLCVATSCEIFSVEYRLAPEHPFPAAIDDVEQVLRWALNEAGDRPVVIAGESAGANLAAVASLRSKRRLAGTILLCPMTSARIELSPGWIDPPFLTLPEIEWYLDQYVPRREDRKSPRFSPELGALDSHLAPTFVATAQCDLLRAQGERYASLLSASGVVVTQRRYDGTFHAFFELANQTTQARRLLADITDFIGTLKP